MSARPTWLNRSRSPAAIWAAIRPPRSRINNQRDWTVVDQHDLHMSAEDTAEDVAAELAERVSEGSHQRLGDRAWRRGLPGRAAALAGAGVEGELADHEQRGT